MKDGATYFKYSVILICVLLIFLLFRRCGNGKTDKPTKDTIAVKEVVKWLPSKKDTVYVPKIEKIYTPKPYTVHDTLESFEYVIQKVDTATILKDYYTEKLYADTQSVQYGNIIIHDVITKNQIKQRRLQSNFTIPEVTKTITIKNPPRVTAYLGFSAMGNKETMIYATGASFGIMAKNGKLYNGTVHLSKDGGVLYGGQVLLPIRLRKN